MTTTIDQLKEIGDKSNFICPDCGGGLYAVKNDPTHRYRCHTGMCMPKTCCMTFRGSIWKNQSGLLPNVGGAA